MVSTFPGIPATATRQRNVILVVLLGLAVAGWVVFLQQSQDSMAPGVDADMSHDMADMDAHDVSAMDADAGPDLTMGRSWPIFAGSWVAMMVAMMFPAAAPMVLMYGRMKRSDPLAIALFTGVYLMLWLAFGVLAYLLSAAVEASASEWTWVSRNWGRVGGVLLILAGVYQVTPLKDVCLRECRSPLSFVMSHWRDGRYGAVQMGVRHGLYCMGCCWLLFLILIPLGLMNAAAMVCVAVLVFVEKVLPWGRPAARVAGLLLFGAGVAVVLSPDLLPTVA